MIVDLTNEHGEEGKSICPVCGIEFDIIDLPAHCEEHLYSEIDGFTAALSRGGGEITCEVCGVSINLEDLQSHELAHALQDVGNEGVHVETATHTDQESREDILIHQLRAWYGSTSRSTSAVRCFRCGKIGHWASDCSLNPDNIAAKDRIIPRPTHALVAAAQLPDPQWIATTKGDPAQLIRLLAKLLVQQTLDEGVERSRSILCGNVAHFGGQTFDSGWGCGYRNIQIQVHYLLRASGSAATCRALFAGAAFVPDIASLQAWIECAWRAGFDTRGADELARELQGGKKWIGTCEATALLRYFGLDTKIVDFGVQGDTVGAFSEENTLVESSRIHGAHPGIQCDSCAQSPIIGMRHKSKVLPNFDLCSECHRCRNISEEVGPFVAIPPPTLSGGIAMVPGEVGEDRGGSAGLATPSPAGQRLLEWTWKYFLSGAEQEENGCGGEGSSGGPTWDRSVLARPHPEVVSTNLPPIYLQHKGHSRTIIGIEMLEYGDGRPPALSLLMLDPGVHPEPLQSSLVSGQGWQRWIKRKAHTLHQSQFQVMYIPRGEHGEGIRRIPVDSREYEASKVIAASERY